MKLITNKLNNSYLRDILPNKNDDIDGVLAAIAYGSSGANENEDLIGNCLSNKCRLDIWMRYDHTVPVSVRMLERLLKNHRNNIYCKLIPDYLHSKVIWWKGYGAYIGSANLTERAWLTNIEAGIFLTEEELHSNDMAVQLEDFFDNLNEIEQSIPLSEEVIEEMRALNEKRRDVADVGKDQRSQKVWDGPSNVNKIEAADRKKERFLREWQATLQTLREIGKELADNRPVWITDTIPIEWQTDQFLNAYYYNHVGEGQKRPYEEFYLKNHSNPQAALEEQIHWWKGEKTSPSNEDQTLYESAPYIREHLHKDKLLNLSPEEFRLICAYTHATEDHLTKIPATLFGRKAGVRIKTEERTELFADWIMEQQNRQGWDIRKLLYYVLYEGKDEELVERLYNAARNPKYRFSHYGLSSLAEVVGWARPEIAPPRNGRTSKALRALGYDVKIY